MDAAIAAEVAVTKGVAVATATEVGAGPSTTLVRAPATMAVLMVAPTTTAAPPPTGDLGASFAKSQDTR